MLNRFLARKEVVEILLDNQKASALLSPTTRAVVRWFGTASVAWLGYPPTVEARTTARDIFRMMSPILQGSLVDFGCAFGAAHTFEFARRLAPHPVLGLDIDPVSIDVARRLNQVLRFDNLSFELADIIVSSPNGQFDIVFTAETLEHLQDDRAAMRTLARMVKSTGWLAISVPYCASPVEYDVPQAVFNAPQGSADLFPGGYHWRSGYNETGLRALLGACGFEVVSVVYTKCVCALPDRLVLFPVNYPLSGILSPLFGVVRRVNVLARRLGQERG